MIARVLLLFAMAACGGNSAAVPQQHTPPQTRGLQPPQGRGDGRPPESSYHELSKQRQQLRNVQQRQQQQQEDRELLTKEDSLGDDSLGLMGGNEDDEEIMGEIVALFEDENNSTMFDNNSTTLESNSTGGLLGLMMDEFENNFNDDDEVSDSKMGGTLNQTVRSAPLDKVKPLAAAAPVPVEPLLTTKNVPAAPAAAAVEPLLTTKNVTAAPAPIAPPTTTTKKVPAAPAPTPVEPPTTTKNVPKVSPQAATFAPTRPSQGGSQTESDDVFKEDFYKGRPKPDSVMAPSIITIVATVVGIFAMIFTAWQMSDNPDGIFASMCRLVITCLQLVFRIIASPCRKCMPCCFSSHAGNGYHEPYGHMRVSTMDYGYKDPALELS